MYKILVFAPLSACKNWKDEFLKFSNIPENKILVLTMHGKKRHELLKNFSSGVVITNYEATTTKTFYPTLKEWGAEILVLDESHLLKNATTSRFKLITPIADSAKFRYILTGTPIANSPMDLYGQFRIMDKGENFGNNFFAFKNRFCWDRNAFMPRHCYFPKWEIKQSMMPVITEVVNKNSSIVKKEDCLDLPPLMNIPVNVELSKEQRDIYETMKRDFVVEAKGILVKAEFAMTKTLRMQQIIAGFLSNSSGDKPVNLKIPRIESLSDLISGLQGKKVIIWSNFVPTYKMIEEVCLDHKRKVVMLTGEQTVTEKQRSIDDFCKGDADIFISNPAAGGTSINLIESSYSIYYSRGYSLTHYIQSQARNYRAGSNIHDRITHYNLVATDTIDEVILKALNSKQDVAESVLTWAKSFDNK